MFLKTETSVSTIRKRNIVVQDSLVKPLALWGNLAALFLVYLGGIGIAFLVYFQQNGNIISAIIGKGSHIVKTYSVGLLIQVRVNVQRKG
jgi:hypothetical protein